jgi:hypothetical protein
MLSNIKSDVGWLSDLATSCASTIKSDIIEAWKRRKKEEQPKRSLEAPQEEVAAEAGPAKAGPTSAKAGPTG